MILGILLTVTGMLILLLLKPKKLPIKINGKVQNSHRINSDKIS